MEGVVADARRIEKILQEQPASGVDSLMESMNRQIQVLKKDLLKAHEKLAAQPTAAPQTAPLSHTVATTQPPPASLSPPQRTQAAAPQPQPKHPNIIRNVSLILIEMKTLSPSGDRTGGLCDASSVMGRGILPTAVLPAHCCSAC